MENNSVISEDCEPYSSLAVFNTPPGNPTFVKILGHINICLQCKGVLHDPVQLACGHLVCSSPCLENLFSGQAKRICNYENCGTLIQKSQFFPDAYRRREISRLLVYCTYRHDGCKVNVSWRDLKKHETTCEFRRVPCSLSREGCEALVTVRDLKNHQMNDCLYVSVNCRYCKTLLFKKDVKEHEVNVCTSILLDCPYKCGLKQVSRFQYNIHIGECDYKLHVCSFSCVGCGYSGKKTDIRSHEQSGTPYHTDLIRKYIMVVDKKHESMMAEILSLKEERESSKSHIKQLQEIINAVHSELITSRQTTKELKMQIASQTEKIINLKRKVEDKADKDVVERNERSLTVIKQAVQQLSTRITAVERQGPRVNNNHGVSDHQATLIRRIDQQCSLHDVRLAELDLRFQIMETANYDGVLMWKIMDFRRRFQEAKDGKTLSLFSQPFYTNRFGYRMCARLYLNGDGLGKGKYLSFFIVIMRGDYDNLLSWPFRHNVSLLLLDQDKRVQNICETFTPDPNSNSFRKPTSEMNVASGVPCFFEHSRLLNERTYLYDDTIYLKIKVANPTPG